MKFVRYFTTLILSILLATDFIHAASDGDLDTTSTGSTFISLGVSNLVRITGIDGIDFGIFSGSGNLMQDDDVCIWTNDSSGDYKVTANGDGTAGAFTVKTSGGETLPYSVKWNDQTGTNGNVSLTSGATSAVFGGASTTSSTCGGVMNANYQVLLDEDDMLSSRPGVYSGVLTLVISPSS